ncbi:hypothetical protein ACO22_02789 [Paracoccidioides brasiliensis]|uniref:Vacuolar membrane PQ loop repeat protein n=1 Tax=Paracoccidioides brasiliensis TaxID=121759 RepID=A0A1D2JHQ6_PARBR|nr:hypothetical protein ACO22_02789 [Paracoccidioides brasiliensis]
MFVLADSVPLTAREVASGVLGSICLACWIFLLVPQLIENYKNGSADAVSLAFLFVWFIGDITNLIGSLWAQLVPVIITIAIYFCLADGILISQCIYYDHQNARRDAAAAAHERSGSDYRTLSSATAGSVSEAESDAMDPTTPLLSRRMSQNLAASALVAVASRRRRRSTESMRRRRSSHLQDSLTKILEETEPRNAWARNSLSVIGICAAGAAGWLIAWQSGVWHPTSDEHSGQTVLGAQVMGYCEDTSDHQEFPGEIMRRPFSTVLHIISRGKFIIWRWGKFFIIPIPDSPP